VETPEAEQVFSVRQLLPARWLSSIQPYSVVLEALHIQDEHIGYLVFCTQPPSDASECDIFQALRMQISSALKGVSLRQKLQVALRQAEEANILKSRFLSMVSHELRTPLNLIVGVSEMALRQQVNKKATVEILRKYHEQIYVSGQHLDRLIRDVLDLASNQVGQMKLICKPLDLVPVLYDAASMAEQLAEQKDLDFRVNVPDRLPPVWGDKTRLRQVLLNLLSNAVKFTARGRVELEAKVQPPVSGVGAGEIVIKVKDTGLGIPKEDQLKIFDEFAQSSRTAVRGYGGIGLGLAITRLLVELHGGRIWVSSAGSEDAGSVFCFSLPIMTALTLAEQEPLSSQGVVLVLTQAPGQAQPLTSFLTSQGFTVEEVALQRGTDALGRIRARPPGAVVLDFAPAAEQGWEIMHDLKQNPATQDIPVLFYSLLVEQDAGVVVDMDYLTKPIGAEQLAKALRRHGLVSAQRKTIQTILIIDDEPGILEMHSRMVQGELPNSQVLVARDGRQGLELMREFVPDLVLLDLMMPVLDGFGVLKAMQEEMTLRNIPVIILSGHVITEDEMSRLSQGVAAVLGKGIFSRQEILERIQNTLARNKRLGTEAQRLVHQAMAFIHENFKQSISRRDIAQHLCVNEQYLSRCFNKELGIAPMGYLSRYRIEQAKLLLEKRNLSITQVALEVGLSSQSYFSRLFQHETGITPSAYQRGERSTGY
jgi:signal transduction histidine kinase/DNA-binding response OmpR family regulator